jgi:hypothetical protein
MDNNMRKLPGKQAGIEQSQFDVGNRQLNQHNNRFSKLKRSNSIMNSQISWTARSYKIAFLTKLMDYFMV